MLYTLIIRGTPETARIEACSRGLELISTKEGEALLGSTIARVDVPHGDALCNWFEEHAREPRAIGALLFFTREAPAVLEQRLAAA